MSNVWNVWKLPLFSSTCFHHLTLPLIQGDWVSKGRLSLFVLSRIVTVSTPRNSVKSSVHWKYLNSPSQWLGYAESCYWTVLVISHNNFSNFRISLYIYALHIAKMTWKLGKKLFAIVHTLLWSSEDSLTPVTQPPIPAFGDYGANSALMFNSHVPLFSAHQFLMLTGGGLRGGVLGVCVQTGLGGNGLKKQTMVSGWYW